MDISKSQLKSWYSKLVDLSDNDRLSPVEKANLELILFQLKNEIKYPQVHSLFFKSVLYDERRRMAEKFQRCLFQITIQQEPDSRP